MVGIGVQELICLAICFATFMVPLIVAFILIRNSQKKTTDIEKDYDDQ